VFIDGVLVIDIGGIHTKETKKVSLPELVSSGILDIEVGDTVDFDFFFMERMAVDSNFNIRTDIDFTYKPISSEWATAELQQADELGLIPDSLRSADLKRSITRAEFAAVSVKAYEALSSKPAIPALNNPFTDTNDVEVLKAYNVGITTGTSATAFDPNALLNREQAATMLTRVFKAVTQADLLTYTKPAPFADDTKISDWAKDSVYFMAANNIINGVGGNNFAPQNTTDAEAAQGYANATREQALIIAVRMVQNLRN
jgi:fibro-slime domain-containing protein